MSELPPRELAGRLSDALAPMRARLLRRTGIAHRRRVLDLGAGWGFASEELARRTRGSVVALDRRSEAVRALRERGIEAVRGEATELPFEAGSFELVFCQQVLMWQPSLGRVLAEIGRVLSPGGVLVALEPDWGGALEHPPELAIAPVARAALARAGADPLCGRALPAALAAAGFTALRVDLLPAPGAPDETRFDLLADLELEPAERERLAEARAAQRALSPEASFVHVPFVCATAARPMSSAASSPRERPHETCP